MHQQFYVEDDEVKKEGQGKFDNSTLKVGKEVVSYVDEHVSTEANFVLESNSLTCGVNLVLKSNTLLHEVRVTGESYADKDKSRESLFSRDVDHTPNFKELNKDVFNSNTTTAMKQMDHDRSFMFEEPINDVRAHTNNMCVGDFELQRRQKTWKLRVPSGPKENDRLGVSVGKRKEVGEVESNSRDAFSNHSANKKLRCAEKTFFVKGDAMEDLSYDCENVKVRGEVRPMGRTYNLSTAAKGQADRSQ